MSGYIALFGYILTVGVATFLQKLSLKSITHYQLFFLMSVGMMLVGVGVYTTKLKGFDVSFQEGGLGLLVGVLFGVGSLLFAISLSSLSAGTASAISISYVLVVVILSRIFLSEPLSPHKIAGIVITLIGVGLLYYK